MFPLQLFRLRPPSLNHPRPAKTPTPISRVQHWNTRGNAAANDNEVVESLRDSGGTLTVTKSYVHLEVFADCPFSVAQDYAIDYLRRAEADVSFGARNDTDERGRSHDELFVQLAACVPLLPRVLMQGTLRFRIAGSRTRLVLDASYVPPGAVLGRIFDAVVGHRVAVKMCRDLVRRIAGKLTEREGAWRPEPPHIARRRPRRA